MAMATGVGAVCDGTEVKIAVGTDYPRTLRSDTGDFVAVKMRDRIIADHI